MKKFVTRDTIVKMYPELFLNREDLLDLWEETYKVTIPKLVKENKLSIDKFYQDDTYRRIGSYQEDYLKVRVLQIAIVSYRVTHIVKRKKCLESVMIEGICHFTFPILLNLLEIVLNLRGHIRCNMRHTSGYILLDNDLYILELNSIRNISSRDRSDMSYFSTIEEIMESIEKNERIVIDNVEDDDYPEFNDLEGHIRLSEGCLEYGVLMLRATQDLNHPLNPGVDLRNYEMSPKCYDVYRNYYNPDTGYNAIEALVNSLRLNVRDNS